MQGWHINVQPVFLHPNLMYFSPMQTYRSETRNQSPSAPRELLTFTLGKEEYGIDTLKVREIRGHEPVTTIANSPKFITGEIKLRGISITIMDMRIKFNLDNINHNKTTKIIILNVPHQIKGMVVDSVSDIVTLNSDQLIPVPECGVELDTPYLQGLGAVDERMIKLMDIEKLMSSREIELFRTQYIFT